MRFWPKAFNGLQAVLPYALGLAADRGHVVQSSTPLQPFAQGGAGMQPRPVWISRDLAPVRSMASHEDR